MTGTAAIIAVVSVAGILGIVILSAVRTLASTWLRAQELGVDRTVAERIASIEERVAKLQADRDLEHRRRLGRL